MPTSVEGAASLPPDCKKETLGVAFFDLSRFDAWASSEDDEHCAAFLQHFYAITAAVLEPSGCRIVKFMGDSGLAVFPVGRAEDAIFALCELAEQTRRAAANVHIDTYCNVSVHVGEAVTGSFGPPGLERFDVIGKTVNVAARLGRRGVVLSTQAFRTLSEDARARFQKVTRPTTYALRRPVG